MRDVPVTVGTYTYLVLKVPGVHEVLETPAVENLLRTPMTFRFCFTHIHVPGIYLALQQGPVTSHAIRI
jgi:hypothetical protein